MSMTASPDYRIFGFQPDGQLRANLYGPDGLFYSWVWAKTPLALARKLAEQWSQPVAESEWEAIEALELADAALRCEDCGGSGIDAGGLSAIEPEDCRSCGGTGHGRIATESLPAITGDPMGTLRATLQRTRTVPALVDFGTPAPAPRIGVIGNGLYVRIGNGKAGRSRRTA